MDLEARIKELEDDLEKFKEKVSKTNTRIFERLEGLGIQLTEVNTNYKNILTRLNEQKESIDGISQKLDDLRMQPAKRWDSTSTTAVSTVVSALIAAAVAFFVGK